MLTEFPKLGGLVIIVVIGNNSGFSFLSEAVGKISVVSSSIISLSVDSWAFSHVLLLTDYSVI